MTTLQQSTIRVLAAQVMGPGVEVEMPIPGSTVRRVYEFKGYEWQARRVAILLKSRGIPAKAGRNDEYVRAFTVAERVIICERADEARRMLDAQGAR